MLIITMEVTTRILSKKYPLLNAEKSESAIDKIELQTKAGIVSESVTAPPSKIILDICCWVLHDFPKLKVKADLIISMYCKKYGLSSPNWWFKIAICSFVACLPSKVRAGSPPERLKQTNIRRHTPRNIGIA